MIEREYGQQAIVDGIVLITKGATDYAVNPTINQGDVMLSQDGSSFVPLVNLPTATPSGSTSIRAVFEPSEMQCKRLVVRFRSLQVPKLWEDQELIIETYGHVDAQRSLATEILTFTDGIETGITLKQAIRACLAVLSGVVTGYPSGPGTFRAPDGVTPRVTVTHDASGNRLVITLNL